MTETYRRPEIGWSSINTENVTHVSRENELPEPKNGVRTLENRVYKFDGFVSSPHSLDISNSPVFIGSHGSQDGFIHTGGSTALTGTNGAFFANNFFFSAPGGTMFDISGDQSTEMLVESTTFSDAANLGNLVSLGTIDGFRVPSFKGCNFEDFADGLTFTGSPEKIFISGSPFRGVSDPGVTILQLDSNLTTRIVDFVDNYIRNVQSDTIVWDVDSTSVPTGIFQYRGTTHDSSVTKSNILTGGVGIAKVGTITTDSYPLRDTIPTITIDSSTTTTITGSGAGLTQINAPTTVTDAQKMSSPGDGQVQYDGRADNNLRLDANVSATGSNTEYTIVLAKNGTILTRARVAGTISNSSTSQSLAVGASIDAESGDTFSVYLENTGGTVDLDVTEFNLRV